MRLIDLTGQRYGKLTVVSRAPNKGKRVAWHCQCECGRTKVVAAEHLRSGNTSSCGCKISPYGFSRHGHSNTRTYVLWENMIQRCHNPNHPHHKNYGALGVTVCDSWRSSYESYLADMGEVPEGLSIDRIDPRGNYEPSNCRYVDTKTQQRNKRNTVYATIDGFERPLADWYDEMSPDGLTYKAVAQRVRLGWSPIEALTTPPRRRTSPCPPPQPEGRVSA